jgi:hypothetical protein
MREPAQRRRCTGGDHAWGAAKPHSGNCSEAAIFGSATVPAPPARAFLAHPTRFERLTFAFGPCSFPNQPPKGRCRHQTNRLNEPHCTRGWASSSEAGPLRVEIPQKLISIVVSAAVLEFLCGIDTPGCNSFGIRHVSDGPFLRYSEPPLS